jgi:hypothetical protein
MSIFKHEPAPDPYVGTGRTEGLDDPYRAKWLGIAQALREQDDSTRRLVCTVDARVAALHEQVALVGVAVKELEQWRKHAQANSVNGMVDTHHVELESLNERLATVERRFNMLVAATMGEGYSHPTAGVAPLREQVRRAADHIAYLESRGQVGPNPNG